ncbi:HD-GYP domain-containing protein [Ruminococcaceae bacterium OttesenSCG-928-L11]|nr:HD-GYP domain-containing protein [Ruminococcaceae bacterium OttesenSCG-928-L11]
MRMVFIDNVQRGMVTAQDIYRDSENGIPLVVKHTALTDFMISELMRYNIKFVYIDDVLTKQRFERMRQSTQRQIYVPKPKPIITTELRNTAVGDVKGLFESIRINPEDIHSSARIIRQLDSVVDRLVDSLTSNANTVVNINNLKSYDDYTYHHSLSVAVLSIAVGQYLNLGREELRALGTSAILHDIGKTAVPIEIINKTSKLSNEEFDIIKTHSPEGYEYLLKTMIGDENICAGVLSHHEKMDGSGYPNKEAGNHIHLWAKIISVADVYDALTSNRPYRMPMQPSEAVEYIMGGIDTSFDYDVVQAFVKKVELYPVASYVELSNDKIGVVLNNSNTFRPVVRALDTGEILDLYSDKSMRSVVIRRVVAEAEIKGN